MAGIEITQAPSSSSFSLPASSAVQSKPSFSFDLSVTAIDSPWLRQSARVWEYIKINLRFGSLCLSVSIIGCILFFVVKAASDIYQPLMTEPLIWPCAFPAIGLLLYDLAELVVRFVRHGRGMPPKALIGLELTALFAALGSAAIYTWQAIANASSWLDSWYMGLILVTWAMILLSCLTRLFLFIRACVDRSRELKVGKPRVMHVPSTGEVVYLVPRPRRKLDDIDMFDGLREATTGGKEAAATTTASSEPGTARPEDAEHVPPLPPRPVHRPTGLMNPPPDDYEPDEAELERRRRGDAQPQLLLPSDMAPKFSSNIANMSPGGAFAVESKVLGRPNWGDSDSMRSSEAVRRRSF